MGEDATRPSLVPLALARPSRRVLREGMIKESRYAVAKVVMFGKEHIVLLRPAGSLLEMFELDYDFQVKKHTEFADLVPKMDVDPEELDMTKSLIETKTAQKFDLAAYKDTNTEQLKQLIEAGQELLVKITNSAAT